MMMPCYVSSKQGRQPEVPVRTAAAVRTKLKHETGEGGNTTHHLMFQSAASPFINIIPPSLLFTSSAVLTFLLSLLLSLSLSLSLSPLTLPLPWVFNTPGTAHEQLSLGSRRSQPYLLSPTPRIGAPPPFPSLLASPLGGLGRQKGRGQGGVVRPAGRPTAGRPAAGGDGVRGGE
jgi:hypothetical protein